MKNKALELLQKYWGYNSFKPSQEEVIDCVLDRCDTVALLPTGGGKSVCFQLPAMMMEGLCLVISPLVALIEDQINNLTQRNIKAIGLTGNIPKHDLTRLLDNALYGGYKFLYLSPERLGQEVVVHYLSQISISFIVIDEGHCISQWGHDFRPSYRKIHLLRALLPKTPLLVLTATATEEVLQDIIKNLEIARPKIIKQSFERKNISYDICKKTHKQDKIIDLLRAHQGTAIVYVFSRRQSEHISQLLHKSGITAAFFHGGLPSTEKITRLKLWMENKYRVMVATNAFGMGIDKATVRLVIHMSLPDSVENYYQETGRAGRDNRPSKAILMYNNKDAEVAKNRFLEKLPTPKTIQNVYRELNNYFQIAYGTFPKESFDFDLRTFCQMRQLDPQVVHQGLKALDRYHIISFAEKAKESDEIMFLVSGEMIRNYMKKTATTTAKVIESILRTYTGAYGHRVDIDIYKLANKSGLNLQKFRSILQRLHQESLISYKHQISDMRICFLVSREDNYTISPIFKHLKEYKKVKTKQLSEMISYATSEDSCRSLFMLNYLGENKKQACGKCWVCHTKALRSQQKTLKKMIIKQLFIRSLSVEALSEILQLEQKHTLEILRRLLDEEVVRMESNLVKLNRA